MTDTSRGQNASLDPARRSQSNPDVSPSDTELDGLLTLIRRAFDVRAAVIGLAGPESPVDGGTGSGDGTLRLQICAGVPVAMRSDEPLGILLLADTGIRRMSDAELSRLADFADEAARLLVRRRDALAIVRLRTEVEAQGRVIADQAAALTHSRKVFERSSAAARIGVWECSLPDETLSWTDGVYDIFEIPRGAPLDRGRTLACYPQASRALLEQTRSRAIAERSGFSLDTEIVTMTGRHRWIRLTATVECENGVPVRIFGMKQDITEEKTLADRTRYLAEFDVMTGLANRTQFQTRLGALSGENEADAVSGALLLIDLDGFKQVNDTYGHAAGDECLREAAQRLQTVCAGADLIARIGGDEFAVLLGAVLASGEAESIAAGIVAALGQPVERGGRVFQLGASVGIAWIGRCTPAELFTRADAALYAAKAAGKQTFRAFGRSRDRDNDVPLPIPALPIPALPMAVEALLASETLPNGHAVANPP